MNDMVLFTERNSSKRSFSGSLVFLTVDGFCAEYGNLDVGVSDAKEFKSIVHEHFKAFFRK